MRNWPYAKIEDNRFDRFCQQIRVNIRNIEEIGVIRLGPISTSMRPQPSSAMSLLHKRAVQSFSRRSSSLRAQPHSRLEARNRDNMEISYSPWPHVWHGRVRLQNARRGNKVCSPYLLAWDLGSPPSRRSFEAFIWIELERKIWMYEMVSQHDVDGC